MKPVETIKLIIYIMQMAGELKPLVEQVVGFIKWCVAQFKSTEDAFPSREGVASLTPKSAPLERLTEIKKANFDSAVATKFRDTFHVPLIPQQVEAIRGAIDLAVNPKYKLREWKGGRKP